MSDTYFLIKPDAVKKGLWRQILSGLEKNRKLGIKLFFPSPGEALEIYPDFQWNRDFFEDWSDFYGRGISLIGVIYRLHPSDDAFPIVRDRALKQELVSIEDDTLSPSRFIHVPNEVSENESIKAAYERGGPAVDAEVLSNILPSFNTSCPDDKLTLLMRLELRSQLLGRKMTSIFTQLRVAEPGSPLAHTLMRNFLMASRVIGLPLLPGEEFRLQEVLDSPVTIASANLGFEHTLDRPNAAETV